MPDQDPPPTCTCHLVGRSEERRALDQVAQHVAAGRSRALVVLGEPGIGKSALLEHLDEQCRPHALVLRVAGVQSEQELAFAGLHQLTGSLMELADALPAPQRTAVRVAFGIEDGAPAERFLVALAVHGLLAQVAQDRPVLCVVDDHQWLDSASGQALAFIARRLREEAVSIVLAARTPTADLETLPILRLEGLAAPAMGELLDSTLPGPLDDEVRRRLVDESAGNPLAMVELARGVGPAGLAGGYALPDAVTLDEPIEESFRARLARLPPSGQRLVLLAAVEPTGAPDLLWAAAASEGLAPDAASPALQDGLVQIGRRVRFQHPLARSAVYRHASLQDRRSAHATLAGVTSATADPDRRAWHLAAAAVGPDEAVAAELDRCAERAQSRGGMAAAAAFRRTAAGLTADPVTRVDRLLTAAEITREAGDLDAALELLDDLGQSALEPLADARRLRLRGQISLGRERSESAFADLVTAARLLEPLAPALARLTYLEALHAAIWMSGAGDFTIAKNVAAAIPTTLAHGRPRSATDALVGHMLSGFRAQMLEGYAAAERSMRRAVDLLLGDPDAAAPSSVLFQIALSLPLTIWDGRAWLELADRAVDGARRVGALTMLPSALSSLAVFRAWEGDLTTATGLVEEARDVLFETGAGFRVEIDLILAAWRGAGDVTTALAAQMRESHAAGEPVPIHWCAYAEAVLLNALGRFDEALDAALPLLGEDHVATSSMAATELADAASRSAAFEILNDLRAWVHERVTTAPTPWALGVLERIDALRADASSAEAHYAASLAHLKACPSRPELARTHLAYGEWLRRQGRRNDARRELRAARTIFEDMGAAGFADRAVRELRAAGERTGEVVPPRLGELTAQEQQVALLARQGLTNPEIGARLFISRRTVQYHLRKVYLKLDITSRAQLPGLVDRDRD